MKKEEAISASSELKRLKEELQQLKTEKKEITDTQQTEPTIEEDKPMFHIELQRLSDRIDELVNKLEVSYPEGLVRQLNEKIKQLLNENTLIAKALLKFYQDFDEIKTKLNELKAIIAKPVLNVHRTPLTSTASTIAQKQPLTPPPPPNPRKQLFERYKKEFSK